MKNKWEYNEEKELYIEEVKTYLMILPSNEDAECKIEH